MYVRHGTKYARAPRSAYGLRRNPILRGWVNRSGQDSSPIHSGLLRCLVGNAIGDTRRIRVDPTIEDEAAARAGAAARATCDVGTLHGTYLGANDGTVTGGLTRARSLRQSFSGLTATAI